MQSRSDAPMNDRIEAPVGEILGEGAVDVQAAPEEVFTFWRHLENLPRFMSHVKDVTQIGPGRYTWTVDGPLGGDVVWDAVTTQVVENEMLGWQSVPDSGIVNSGTVRFEPLAGGGTRVRVRLAYSPPAGKIGHAIASLLGDNPEQQMQDDLAKLRMLFSAAPAGQTTTH